MKKVTTNSIAILLSTMVISGVAFSADRAIADGLAAAGAAQYAKGNVDLAKDFLYKALVNDENCTDAVFELARVFDKENNAAASDFYQRSIQLFLKEGKAADPAKRAEAEKRVKVLNPHGPRLASTYEEYAQDLDRLVKRMPEPAVKEAAYVRATELELPTILPADKMPKFYAAAQAAAKAAAAHVDTNKKSGEKTTSPEVERELKALGWTTVKGYFEKKGPGVYESTEGRLEAAKTNGALEFTIVSTGGDGEVVATVRSEFKVDKNNDNGGQGGGGKDNGGKDSGGGSDKRRGPPGGFGGWGRRQTTEGYGFVSKAKDYKEYGVDENTNKFFASKGPVEVGSGNLSGDAKNQFMIQVADNSLEFTVNGKRGYHVNSGKLAKAGPFVIDVNGTVTLENPRCTGH